MRTRQLSFGFIAALILAGCAGKAAPVSSDAGPTRTVEVRALDTMRFEPATIEVRAGETIRFMVTNAGKMQHEFILGDEGVQAAHAQKMGMAGHGQKEALASLSLQPGETKESAVAFKDPGKVLFGCHIASHYAAGMVGSVNVT